MISSNTTRRPTCDALSLSCAWPTLCRTPALTRPKRTYSTRQALLSCQCPCLALGGSGFLHRKSPGFRSTLQCCLSVEAGEIGVLKDAEWEHWLVRTWYNKEWSLGKQFPSSSWQISENCNAVEMCQFFLCLCSVLQHPVGWVRYLVVGCGLATKWSWSVPSGSSVTGAVSPNSYVCLILPTTSPCQSWLGWLHPVW